MLKTIVNNPYINLIAGMILLITASVEIYEAIEAPQLGIHHGIFFYAIVQILKSIPEILHGFDDIEKAKNQN